MQNICNTCKGTRMVKPVFSAKPMPCQACLAPVDPKNPKSPRFSTGFDMSSKVRCPVCEGGRSFMSNGGMSSTICSYCMGTGKVDESKIKADVEQINIEHSKDTQAKADVDKGTADSNERIGSNDREKSTVGTGHHNLQERAQSKQGAKEGRCDERS
jgi:hypothetical protein